MFVPCESTGRFDFTLFGGEGEEISIETTEPIDLLYYWAGNVPVGTIQGKLKAEVYRNFQRSNFYPIKINLDGTYYCGWIHESYVK